jgi:hypothetical protein
MQAAAMDGSAGERHIDLLLADGALERSLAHGLRFGCERGLQCDLDAVGGLSRGGALFLAQSAEPAKDLHQVRAAAQIGDAPRFQPGLILDGVQSVQRVLFNRVQIKCHIASCHRESRIDKSRVVIATITASRE